MVDIPHPRDDATPAVHRFPILPPEFTICAAAQIRQQWLAWWPEGAHPEAGTVRIDASAVNTVDGAGIQLLIALRHWLNRKNLTLNLERPSKPLQAACATAGLVTLLFEAVAE